jgi:hypothetical protein
VGSLFAPVWPLVGLTPLTETQALFDRIESLRREVRQLTAPRTYKPVEHSRATASRGRRGQNGSQTSEKKSASISQ